MSPQFTVMSILKTIIFVVPQEREHSLHFFLDYRVSASLLRKKSLPCGIGIWLNELFKVAPLNATLPPIPICYLASESPTLHHHLDVQIGENEKRTTSRPIL
jgi:hypothetical protein